MTSLKMKGPLEQLTASLKRKGPPVHKFLVVDTQV